MNSELKAKWTAALRSGDYVQGYSALKNGSRYCCLGVLCAVGNTPIIERQMLLSDINLRDLGVTDIPQHLLSGMNDGVRDEVSMECSRKYSFAEIADYIDTNL